MELFLTGEKKQGQENDPARLIKNSELGLDSENVSFKMRLLCSLSYNSSCECIQMIFTSMY